MKAAIVLLLLTGALPAAVMPAEDPPTGELPAGYEEVTAALGAAGQDVSAGRLSDLAEMPRAIPALQAGFRTAGGMVGTWRRESRLRGRGGPARTDLRAWWWEDGTTEQAGWVGGEWADGMVLAGGWGWRAGFGLLVGGAGRRAGLTADGGLGPGGAGLRGWSRPLTKRAVRGVGVRQGLGPLVLGLAAGESPSGRAVLMSLSHRDRLWQILAVRGPGGQDHVGGNGHWRHGSWYGGWEAVVPVMTPLGRGGALAFSAGWRHRREMQIEGLVSLATGATSILAAPPMILGTRGGDGWALRGWVRLEGSTRIALLVSRARRRDQRDGLQHTMLVDTRVDGRLEPGLQWELAWRVSDKARPVWQDATPWLPPDMVRGIRRRALSAQLRSRRGPVTWRLELRTLAVDDRRRSLLAAAVATPLGHALELRGGLAHAWGGAVDLISVLVPVPGRVLARHWGAWQGETWLGWGRGRGSLRWSASLHLRRPATGGAPVPALRMEAILSL